jgi:hypothetical protein
MFTVLVPHYSEKILLSLRETVREGDQNTRLIQLEYLKQLHPVEWDNFVEDTKILVEESGFDTTPTTTATEKCACKADDLPFYCIGFKTASPESTLRMRIWASLRTQTLYWTVAGMVDYSKTIKLPAASKIPRSSKGSRLTPTRWKGNSNACRGGSSSLSSPSSTRRSERTPSPCCALTPTCKFHTWTRNPEPKEATRGFFHPH